MTKTFYISFESVYWFEKRDILITGNDSEVIVLKVYRPRWWKILFMWICKRFGISYKPRIDQIKVKQYES